jgi:hypothetical protein
MKVLLQSYLILISILSYSQEYKIENKSVTYIGELKNKNKSLLFSAANNWVAKNYVSAKDVVQLNDIESGTIIVRGINSVSFKNYYQALTPEIKMTDTIAHTKFNHTLEINTKDDKIRIIFKLNNIAFDDAGLNEIMFNTVNLEGVKEENIIQFNDFLNLKYGAALKGTNFLDNYKLIADPMFKEISKNTLIEIKKTIESIILHCNSYEIDKW